MADPGVGPIPSGTPGTEIDRLRATVGVYFPVYETRITPQSLVLLVHADPATLEERFDRLRRDLWPRFYIPQIRRERGEYVIEVVRRPPAKPFSRWTNVVLLGLTLVTTVSAGAFLWLAYVGGSQLVAADFLYGGLTFGVPLMAILGIHELAHYVLARHHHVEASIPFFIPLPPPFILFGTFGAFISLREPIPSKKALLDIGASGPLAGFAVAVPVTLLGMYLSAHAPVLSVANCGPTIIGVNYGNLLFGLSLFWLALGQFLPVAFVNLHPLALAGWVGLLVTAMNLLPTSQLDGGHVFRALLGDSYRWVSWAGVVSMFALGFLYQGWFIFAILLFFMGVRHPPPLNDITPLDRKRWAVGALAAVILVSGFVVIPLATPSGQFTGTPGMSTVAPPPGFLLADRANVTIVNNDVITHGYLLSGHVDAVQLNGSNRTLSGSALGQFEQNSTWTITFPNGNVTMVNLSGNFSFLKATYATLAPGAHGVFSVVFENRARAVVTMSLFVNEICGFGGSGQEFRFILS